MRNKKTINRGFLIFGIIILLHTLGISFGFPSLMIVILQLVLDVVVILFIYKGKLRFPKQLYLWFIPVIIICLNTVDWKDLNTLKYTIWFVIGILTVSVCLKNNKPDIIYKIIEFIDIVIFTTLIIQLILPSLFNNIILPFLKNTDTYYYRYNMNHGILYGIACDKTAANMIGMLCVSIAFFTYESNGQIKKKWFFILSGAFICAMSGSRTSLVTIPIILYLTKIVCAADRKKLILTLRGLGAALLLVLFVIIIGRVFPSITVLQRISFTITDLMGDRNIGNISSGRDLLYASALQGIVDKPIFGHGWLQFNRNHVGIIDVGTASYVHNIVLQLLYDIGIAGTIVFIIPFIFFYVSLLKQIRNLYKKRVEVKIEYKLSFFLQTILLIDSLLHVGILDSIQMQVYFIGIAIMFLGQMRVGVLKEARSNE